MPAMATEPVETAPPIEYAWKLSVVVALTLSAPLSVIAVECAEALLPR